WLYVYGFVHPAIGRNLERLLPSANTDGMGVALAEFARWAAPEGRKLLVVLVDNAGHVLRPEVGRPGGAGAGPLEPPRLGAAGPDGVALAREQGLTPGAQVGDRLGAPDGAPGPPRGAGSRVDSGARRRLQIGRA